MKRALVTGGAGFVGSNLCRRLLELGYRVICLDNLSTGQMRNIKELSGNRNFCFLQRDVCEPFKAEVDEIYNAACPASPSAYQAEPVRTTRTCVLGAINMLELATATGALMMQFSTSEVYGEPSVHPQSESYRGCVNPIGPRSCYDEGKRCAESLCFDYHRQFGTRIKVIRIFNTYGPGMAPEDGRVVSNFIMQALRGEPLTVYGDGSQTRSFQYIDDLIDGILKVMAGRDDFLGPVNLGNPEEFTMSELAELVLRETGSSSGLVKLPSPPDDPTRRRADISLAASELAGWRPKVHLEEGIRRTIDYFKAFV